MRIVGTINAAIWLGAGVFFSLMILPAVFSADMHKVLHANPAYNAYYSGGIAEVLFRRFFVLQYICGAVAILHLFAEKLYLGRALPKLGTAVVVGIFSLGLLGGIWLQPKMEDLRERMYAGTVEDRERARHSFGLWHGMSQLVNLGIMAGLVVHLVSVTRPVDSTRYGTFTKFRG
ncbi:MAG: hypothetical protein JWR26_670 [Pedosphaera sp.]|nr:hypothetical protein [Pedosphaera sp.]